MGILVFTYFATANVHSILIDWRALLHELIVLPRHFRISSQHFIKWTHWHPQQNGWEFAGDIFKCFFFFLIKTFQLRFKSYWGFFLMVQSTTIRHLGVGVLKLSVMAMLYSFGPKCCWTRSTFIQVMVCHLFGINAKPMLTYYRQSARPPLRIILWCPTTKMLIKACFLIQPLEQESVCQKCWISLNSKVFINHSHWMKANPECLNVLIQWSKCWVIPNYACNFHSPQW